MRVNWLLIFSFALLLTSQNAYAYFNATYLNTTVILNTSTSARVVETLVVYVSNSSISQYNQDRGALNLSLSGWQQALGTKLLVQHIYRSSISNFSLLPGPIIDINAQGGQAHLTMSYIAYNVISISNIAPRTFEYDFSNQSFNFIHAASGEVLPTNARFNIIIPKGTEVVHIYPLPDSPSQNFLGNYTNATTFTWDAGEPLSNFAFSYIVTESPREEVVTYFEQVYNQYTSLIYLGVIVVIAALILYIYVRVFR